MMSATEYKECLAQDIHIMFTCVWPCVASSAGVYSAMSDILCGVREMHDQTLLL